MDFGTREQKEPAKHVQVLGATLTPLDLDRTVKLILQAVCSQCHSYVCIANVYTATLAFRDPSFRKALNGGLAVVADGMPVVWTMRAAGFSDAGRVYGAELVEEVCGAGISRRVRHGFLGGLPGVAESMVKSLSGRHPDLQVAGVWDPGIISAGESASPDLLELINKAAPDILWVGLGAPKQEIWMWQHRQSLTVPVFVGVGQAFDLIAGRTQRPPKWVGDRGLEWLFRLFREPRRLWKRYLQYNLLFVWYLCLRRGGRRPSAG